MAMPRWQQQRQNAQWMAKNRPPASPPPQAAPPAEMQSALGAMSEMGPMNQMQLIGRPPEEALAAGAAQARPGFMARPYQMPPGQDVLSMMGARGNPNANLPGNPGYRDDLPTGMDMGQFQRPELGGVNEMGPAMSADPVEQPAGPAVEDWQSRFRQAAGQDRLDKRAQMREAGTWKGSDEQKQFREQRRAFRGGADQQGQAAPPAQQQGGRPGRLAKKPMRVSGGGRPGARDNRAGRGVRQPPRQPARPDVRGAGVENPAPQAPQTGGVNYGGRPFQGRAMQNR